MKISQSILITLIYLFIPINSYSQEREYCATQTSDEDIQFINNNMDLIRYYENEYFLLKKSKTSTALTSIPVKIHIITNDDGSGGIEINDVLSELDEVNSYFQNSFVEFFVCDDNAVNIKSSYVPITFLILA